MAHAARPPCATTPPRICCTRRCARCSDRTSSRPAAWWNPSPALRLHALHRHGSRRAGRSQKLMNQEILTNIEVHTDVMDLDQALNTGAMALFGEKYGDKVRVVSIPGLQQGTLRRHARAAHRRHRAVRRSCMKAASRPACAASRRSPARRVLQQVPGRGRCRARQSAGKTGGRESARWNATARAAEGKAGARGGRRHRKRLREIKGVKVLAAQVDGMDRAQLRTMVDSLRNKWKSAVVILALGSGFQRLHRLRRHQGPDGESARRQARGRGRAGGRRQRRRPSGHGRSRRQEIRRRCRARSTRVYTTVEGML